MLETDGVILPQNVFRICSYLRYVVKYCSTGNCRYFIELFIRNILFRLQKELTMKNYSMSKKQTYIQMDTGYLNHSVL